MKTSSKIQNFENLANARVAAYHSGVPDAYRAARDIESAAVAAEKSAVRAALSARNIDMYEQFGNPQPICIRIVDAASGNRILCDVRCVEEIDVVLKRAKKQRKVRAQQSALNARVERALSAE